MRDPASRRPISLRNTRIAAALVRRIAATDVTPNQISQGSVVAAAAGALFLWMSAATDALGAAILLTLAAVMIQLRLLCNLLDGMVAIEGGRAEPTGPFWNEVPDRLADFLLLSGAGLAAGQLALGLACAVLAICTAYLREFGRAAGLGSDFRGPMAKQQRMAMLTAGCLLAGFLPSSWVTAPTVLIVTLWLILIGTVATIIRRARHQLDVLKMGVTDRADPHDTP